MKLIKIIPILAIAVLLTGCAGRITPQGAAGLTTAAVYAFGRSNPQITATMREIQPVACEMARNPASTLEDVIGVIQNSAGVNDDTKAVINVLLAIYQTSTYPNQTNPLQSRPYLEAVICPGWAGGLALLPAPGVDAPKSAAPVKHWILVK